ncbi:helix-turn-helix domain-containing protein [Thermomonospora catenispora]|uniref:helix-turn-helix domain-containing protein n=1 Tax=Thermomonospora catenispora TaxID=2493090 RepID=UPI001120BEB2|nr:helix-turn-helix domain-containing protein [Thermomonospora catenispora]TNY34556.1 helix-turn-helix domain-containing protein [Thermomonospora catenispora]
MSYSRIERGPMAADAVGRYFTQISNSLFRDPRISGLAKAVFGLISTHRDGYGVSVETIARHMREGRDAIRKALRELEKYGYLMRVQTRDPKTGRMGPAVYYITDMPDGLDISLPAPAPTTCLPRSAPLAENPPTVLTCENTAEDESFRRSAPSAEIPTTVAPSPVNPTPKKNKRKNTNLSSSPSPSSHTSAEAGEPEEEEGFRDEKSEGPSGEALELVDAAVAEWRGHRPPTPAERLRLAQRAAEALRQGAAPEAIHYALTHDLEPGQVRSAVAVVMARTAMDGWADPAPEVVQAPAAPMPPWCGRCDSPDYRWIQDDDGRVRRCPDCHPYADQSRPKGRQDAESEAGAALDNVVSGLEEFRRRRSALRRA